MTFLKWHLVQLTLAPWHKPQAFVDSNACHKEEEAHKDAERRMEGKECVCVCVCVCVCQRRVKATQINWEMKAGLVFLVSAYLKKVGRPRANTQPQCTQSSVRGLVSVLWI